MAGKRLRFAPLRRNQKRIKAWLRVILFAAVLSLLFLFVVFPFCARLRSLSGTIALSDAVDYVDEAIRDGLGDCMRQTRFAPGNLVSMERDGAGRIIAIYVDVVRLEELAAQIQNRLRTPSDGLELRQRIPIGRVSGTNFLIEAGPKLTIHTLLMTSTQAEFHNELTAAGINQTRHQLVLELTVDMDVLVPWNSLHTQVKRQLLLAETVIVGQVPEMLYTEEN